MKQFILLITLLLTSSILLAQRNFVAAKIGNAPTSSQIQKTMSTFDTLGLSEFNAATKVLYLDQLGNYAAGTNFYGDLAKAQEFNLTSRKNVGKVLFYFAAKKKVAPDSLSYLMVNIYELNGSGLASPLTSKACPGTILHSRKLLLDSIDTIAGHFTTVNFDWAPTGDSIFDFAVGFDMSHLDTADRVGLYSTKDSSANKSQRSWEKQQDGKWYTMLRSWPLDIDFAIFPVVDTLVVGIPSNQAGAATFIQASPNPANETVTLHYSLKEEGPMDVKFFDNNGNLVYSQKIINPNVGKATLVINTTKLPAGVYSYSVQTHSTFQSKKLVIIH